MSKRASARVRRTFTPQFKKDAVAMVRRGKTLAEVASSLGITRGLLQYWRHQLAGESPEPFPGKGKARAETHEIRELKARLKDVTEERDILKKAWPTLRTTRSEVPVRPGAPGDLPGRQDVRGPSGTL
jgi:transposase